MELQGKHWRERVRQEKPPRQRVQKVWRSVRWADTFPDESVTMDTTDITPQFALRKMAVLFETHKHEEFASLVRRLGSPTLAGILGEIPMEMLHEAMPESLCVLEALYARVYDADPDAFPTSQLRTDHLVKKMVTMFARQFQMNNRGENCSSFLPSCRSILHILASVEPQLSRAILQRKRALDRCLHRLGKHGHVETSGGKLMNLHDALKVEFERVVIQYKCALQKLDELSLSTKHPNRNTVTSGPAPTEASHQRQMQLTRGDIQNRVIKNKTLLNAVEPVIGCQLLDRLLRALEKRIEYDKVVLFHDTELRKMCGGGVDEEVYLSVLLRQFSQGYAMLLELLKEAGDDSELREAEGLDSSSEEEANTSTLSLIDRMKAKSLNGIIPFKGVGGRGVSALSSHHVTSTGSVSTASLLSGYTSSIKPGLPESLANSVAGAVMAESKIRGLEREVDNLRQELEQAREQIWRLQDREKQLRDRLSDQAQKQFSAGAGHFENLSLGGRRPTELVRQFGNLYTEGRVDALDALDGLQELEELDILKMKILFSVVVLSFRSAQQGLEELRGRVRHLLCLPVPSDQRAGAAKGAPQTDPPSQALEDSVTLYLRSTVDRFDLSANVKEVCSQIYATLYDYPCLRGCRALVAYVESCLRLSWGLVCQTPPYVISYEAREFEATLHTRFHTSNAESSEIRSFLWPVLLEAESNTCVLKGVVIT